MYTLAIIAMLTVGDQQVDLSQFRTRLLQSECVELQQRAVNKLNEIGQQKGAKLQVMAVHCTKNS